uniref:Piwi domain-containing protein n=1 Tax=Steinernema glaseri TaxID=37863 RepID=A0A1I8AGY5_9BILA
MTEHTNRRGVCGDLVQVNTNVIAVRMPNTTVYHYDVRVIGQYEDGTTRTLSCPVPNDAENVDRISLVAAAFDRMARENAFFFDQPRNFLSYDCEGSLYAVKRLQIDQSGKILEIQDHQVKECCEHYATVRMTIQEAQPLEMRLNNFDFLNDEAHDNKITSFLQSLAAQHALFQMEGANVVPFSTSHLVPLEYAGKGFKEERVPDLCEGTRMLHGLSSSVKYMEGPDLHPQASFVVNWEPVLTHYSINVALKATLICEVIDPASIVPSRGTARLIKQLKGLRVFTTYTTLKHQFEIDRVSTSTSNTQKLLYKECMITVAEYYHLRHKIYLRYPDMPLIVERRSDSVESEAAPDLRYYPMELCCVCPMQRVTRESPHQKQYLDMYIKSMPLLERIRLAQKLRTCVGITNDSFFLQGAGVTVGERMLKVEGRVLDTPRIGFGTGGVVQVAPDCSWKAPRGARFVRPASIGDFWGVIALLTDGKTENNRLGGREDRPKLREFVEAFQTASKRLGIKICDPSLARPIFSTDQNNDELKAKLKACFLESAQLGLKFLLFITSDDIHGVHDWIKVFERDHDIATQDITIDTAMEALCAHRNKPRSSLRRQTILALVSKANIKLGGLNFNLVCTGEAGPAVVERFLLIGIHVERLAGDDNGRLLVGFSANWNPGRFEFAGDFVVSEAAGILNVIRAIIKKCFKKFCRRREVEPLEILIYRSYVPETEYSENVKCARNLLRELAPEAPVTYIVVDRHHPVRLVCTASREGQSVDSPHLHPGTVIDTGIKYPKLEEFYLKSHCGALGTSHVPKYVVLHSDKVWPYDELENLTFTLAYATQTTTSPTSVPAPLFIAESYADRGQRLLQLSKTKGAMDEFELGYYSGTLLENVHINA